MAGRRRGRGEGSIYRRKDGRWVRQYEAGEKRRYVYGKGAGLPPRVRIHDLRYSAATLLLSRGVPVKVVSEMLGRSDVSITLSIYAHVLSGMQDRAAELMDNALS